MMTGRVMICYCTYHVLRVGMGRDAPRRAIWVGAGQGSEPLIESRRANTSRWAHSIWRGAFYRTGSFPASRLTFVHWIVCPCVVISVFAVCAPFVRGSYCFGYSLGLWCGAPEMRCRNVREVPLTRNSLLVATHGACVPLGFSALSKSYVAVLARTGTC
ncbi:hypothetical protein B0T22DRAFT_158155 [Podospora appendiculata]|uniref:Uncharacterized protein n=1 Tax=Podospora appendiculata TaxID=314037 RepID=A0AAE1CCM1_9PEZI|nr:hypothetical protein B0T22DRAFT_158155 [Podospora appendiculata]